MPKEKSEFEAARRKRRRRLTAERLVRLTAAAVVAAAVLFGIFKAVEADVIGLIGDRIAASSDGTSLPVELAGATVRSVFECGGNIGVVTDTAYYLYSSSGKELLYEQHGMSDPAVSSAGRRFLLFDRGGNRLLIRTRDRVLFEKEFPYSVIDATLSQDGWLSVVTGAQRYSAEVTVYGPDYREAAFTWSASGAYVLSAMVGPDGRTVAAVSVGASGGEIYTVLHLFSVNAPEELARQRFDGSTALDVSFSSVGDIKLVCDDMAAMVSRDGAVLGRYDYSGDLLAYSSADNFDLTVLVFDQYRELRSCDAVILGDKCAVLSSAQVDGLVSGASAGRSCAAVFTPGEIYYFAPDGKLTATASHGPEALKALVVGSEVFAVSRDALLAPEFEAVTTE